MSIKRLPDDAIAQIKSSATVTSLNGAVSGLICNSLDSGATRITVSVDYGRGSCTVEDDGMGILPAEFRLGGSLGKLHCECLRVSIFIRSVWLIFDNKIPRNIQRAMVFMGGTAHSWRRWHPYPCSLSPLITANISRITRSGFITLISSLDIPLHL